MKTEQTRPAWNKGKLVGQKPPLRPKAFVDENDHPSVALQDVAGDEAGKRNRQSRYIHVGHRPLVIVIRDCRPVRAVVGILADPARAKHLALADFQ
jgi:hypothetical protein